MSEKRFHREIRGLFCTEEFSLFTGRNEVVAKVIFLHLSVILFTGGVSASVHAGILHPPGVDTPLEQTLPQKQTPPPSRHPTWEQTHTPGADPPRSRHPTWSRHPPPGSRLRHTVNERPVRILLECILVGC